LGSFPQNPLTNIWRAAHQSSSFSFDDTQKPYDIRVHYRDVAQVQNFRFSAVVYLFLYFIESFGLNSADQPDDFGFAVGLPFNLQAFRRLPEDASNSRSRLSLLVLTQLSIALRAPFPTSGRQRTWLRDVVHIAPNAHQKLKLRLVSRGFRGEFGSEVADGTIAEAI
jgi:hypothetical protein